MGCISKAYLRNTAPIKIKEMKKAINRFFTVLIIWLIGLLISYSCHDKAIIEDLLFKDKDNVIFICHEPSTGLSNNDVYIMIRRYPPIAIRTGCDGEAEISSWIINKDTLILNRLKRLHYCPPSYEEPDALLHIEDITDDINCSTPIYNGYSQGDSVFLLSNEALISNKLLIRRDSLLEYHYIQQELDPFWDVFHPDSIPNKDGYYEETVVFKRIDNSYRPTNNNIRTILHEQ